MHYNVVRPSFMFNVGLPLCLSVCGLWLNANSGCGELADPLLTLLLDLDQLNKSNQFNEWIKFNAAENSSSF